MAEGIDRMTADTQKAINTFEGLEKKVHEVGEKKEMAL